jgi:hypothetical protein
MNFLRVILGEGFSVDSCSLFVGTVADVQKDKAYWKEYRDILQRVNSLASKRQQIGIQQSFIVPDSLTRLAFRETEGRGSVSTGVEIPDSPSVSFR